MADVVSGGGASTGTSGGSAPSGGTGGGATSGGSSGSSGTNTGTSTGASTGSSRTGSSTPNTLPSGAAKGTEASRKDSLAARLREAGGETEGGGETASERKMIKHLLEDGREIDVDITDHLSTELAAIRKRKMKVNDKEVEVDLDDAFEKYPLAEGARQKFEDAAQLRKSEAKLQEQVTTLGKQLRDPKSLRAILSDPKMLGAEGLLKFAEGLVTERLRFERMKPEERESLNKQREIEEGARKREADLAAREGKLKTAETERNKVESEKHRVYYQENIPKFLEVAGIPNSVAGDESFKAFVRMKQEAIKLGIPHTNETVAREVAKDYFESIRSVAGRLAPEKLAELLGENAGKVNQAAISAVNAPGSKISVKKAAPTVEGAMPAHIKTPDQYRQWKYDQKIKAGKR